MAQNSRKTRQEVIRDFRCDQILAAAREVIAEAGYAEASVDRIAEVAGVARSTVYVYFDGKEAILESCFDQNRREIEERMRSAVEKAKGVEPKLAAFLEATFGYVDEHRQLFRAVMAVQGLDPFFEGESVPSELARLRDHARLVLAGLLEEGATSGEIPQQDLSRAADLLGVLIYGSLMRRSHRDECAPARAEAEALAHLFLYGVAGL